MGLTEGKPVRLPSGDLMLEGVLHFPDGAAPFPGAVVCHPHPQYGGDMHNNVVMALARACLGRGVAALRFNFRGVGGSEGAYDSGAGELADVAAAVDFLRADARIDALRILMVGYSFGALMALRWASAFPVSAVVAVSPPTVAGPFSGIRVESPLLVAAGDSDQYCDARAIAAQQDQPGSDVRLEVFSGVDHFWWGAEDRLEEVVSGFLGACVTGG